MPAATVEALAAVYCPSEACPEYRRTGRRQIIGRVTPGAVAELRCAKCRGLWVVRAG